MKTTLLFVMTGLFACAVTVNNEVQAQNTLARTSAYDLQELCFGGSDPAENNVIAKMELAECKGYITGVLDAFYYATGCQVKVDYSLIYKVLNNVYNNIPDEELKKFTAASTVIRAFSVTPDGKECFSDDSPAELHVSM